LTSGDFALGGVQPMPPPTDRALPPFGLRDNVTEPTNGPASWNGPPEAIVPGPPAPGVEITIEATAATEAPTPNDTLVLSAEIATDTGPANSSTTGSTSTFASPVIVGTETAPIPNFRSAFVQSAFPASAT
jgi:hypothetical protein